MKKGLPCIPHAALKNAAEPANGEMLIVSSYGSPGHSLTSRTKAKKVVVTYQQRIRHYRGRLLTGHPYLESACEGVRYRARGYEWRNVQALPLEKQAGQPSQDLMENESAARLDVGPMPI